MYLLHCDYIKRPGSTDSEVVSNVHHLKPIIEQLIIIRVHPSLPWTDWIRLDEHGRNWKTTPAMCKATVTIMLTTYTTLTDLERTKTSVLGSESLVSEQFAVDVVRD